MSMRLEASPNYMHIASPCARMRECGRISCKSAFTGLIVDEKAMSLGWGPLLPRSQ